MSDNTHVDIYGDEFPRLLPAGLYAAKINADGNCLFNALSDQLYDTQARHAEIRDRTVSYIRAHADYYKSYIHVYPGGGVRRNPKRSGNSSFSASQDCGPSDDEIDTAFEQHLTRMAQGGTWGDNIEISAFGQAYDVDVLIYSRSSETWVHCSQEIDTKPVVHIAHHDWEHFSSIRNVLGPHMGEGMPNVEIKTLSPADQAAQAHRVASAPSVQPWMIDHLQTVLGPEVNRKVITSALVQHSGNMDAAFNTLLNPTSDSDSYSSHTPPSARNTSSTSSPRSFSRTQAASSSSDEASYKPSESFAASTLPAPSSTASVSRSASPAAGNAKGPKRFRLLPPKPPGTGKAIKIVRAGTPKREGSGTPKKGIVYKTERLERSGSGAGNHGGSKSRSQSPSARLLAPRHRGQGRVEKASTSAAIGGRVGDGSASPVVLGGLAGLDVGSK